MATNEATQAQISAADPTASTWLSANAGSGKTRVLTDRVARLQLSGVDPQHILCLTYTKAAASEMQNRLFQRLGQWSMLPANQLRSALEELGEGSNLSDTQLAHARTLFARAIETPGGLKIQTIHSFCASLLRRFPLEAGVPLQFQEMDDRAAEHLRKTIIEGMVSDTNKDILESISIYFSIEQTHELCAEIARKQESFRPDKTWSDIAKDFHVPEVLNDKILSDTLFDGSERDLLSRVVPAMLAAKTKNDPISGAKLQSIRSLNLEAFDTLCSVFLTAKRERRKIFPSKQVQDKISSDMSALNDFIDRVEAVCSLKKSFSAAQKSFAVHNFARVFLAKYSEAKHLQGWLDFDDLILRTRSLISDPKVADWVLFRLDGGISHILIDEAQDTSPAQWDVVRKLAQDFTSGLSRDPDQSRTLFVVGDKKQSIYSFQGADPGEFDVMQQEFDEKLSIIDKTLKKKALQYSFRSAPAILQLVDATFGHRQNAGFSADQSHQAFHQSKPGRVDLWPFIDADTSKDDRHWTDPVDRLPPVHHTVKLARQIAEEIQIMIGGPKPTLIPESTTKGFRKRPVRPGDIMILVQRRSALFHEIIRACKQLDLPIAGADRLKVAAELAVRDLLSLLSFLATPEDDLSLAETLKSPLFGWSEKQLFDIAHNRGKKFLWEALRSDGPSDVVNVLQELRGQIDFLRPYDLLERVLTRHHGRDRLLSRLGPEAEDGLDALLAQALAYEQSEVPSLTGFLSWARSADLEVKRQADNSGNLIRVMTVHGAKGLEAPIVFLPDCAKRRRTNYDLVLDAEHGPIAKIPSDDAPDYVLDAISKKQDADDQERLRLLYVALTRAESWLIVAGAGELDIKSMEDWYQTIEHGLDEIDGLPFEFPHGHGKRLETGDWSETDVALNYNSEPISTPLDPVFTTLAPSSPERSPVMSPSDLGGAKALPSELGQDQELGMAMGTYTHNLLETLLLIPPGNRVEHVATLSTPEFLGASHARSIHQSVLEILDHPHLRWIFEESGLSEVSIQGFLAGKRSSGTIDRLIVLDQKVIAVDYKTNAAVPETAQNCPEGLLRQMGAYQALLRQVYPTKDIEVGLLWTAEQRYMSLPQNLVSAALARAPKLDETEPDP